jgi:hypothetical protein
MASWAPRRLVAAAGFPLLLSLIHGFSNGPSAKVRAPTGAAGSPRSRRGLQLWRVATKIGGAQRRLGQRRWLSLGPKSTRYMALFIGFLDRIVDGKNPHTFLV